jgi:hypothetical protein
MTSSNVTAKILTATIVLALLGISTAAVAQSQWELRDKWLERQWDLSDQRQRREEQERTMRQLDEQQYKDQEQKPFQEEFRNMRVDPEVPAVRR